MATLESERVAQVQWQFRLVLGMGSLPCAIVLVCHVAETAGKWWKGTNGGETYGKVDIDDKHESGSSGSRKVTHGKNKEQELARLSCKDESKQGAAEEEEEEVEVELWVNASDGHGITSRSIMLQDMQWWWALFGEHPHKMQTPD